MSIYGGESPNLGMDSRKLNQEDCLLNLFSPTTQKNESENLGDKEESYYHELASLDDLQEDYTGADVWPDHTDTPE